MLPPNLRRYLPHALFTLALAVSLPAGLGQEHSAPADPLNIFQTITQGGPLIWAVWLAIVGTSVTMVTFIIQNIITLQRNKLAPPPLITALQQTIAAGNYQEAYEICKANNNNYVANVLKAGLTRVGRGKDAVEAACAEHGLREATLLRTRNSYLSVIGVISPMIGLLGTVIGMMGAFSELASVGADPRALSGKIGEVLLATASGLFIAIPAFVSYYVFRNNSQMCIVHADDIVNTLLLDIPYDELAGVQIGEHFSAGTATAAAHKVSIALTTACPACNGAVAPGITPCPHCRTTLDWQP